MQANASPINLAQIWAAIPGAGTHHIQLLCAAATLPSNPSRPQAAPLSTLCRSRKTSAAPWRNLQMLSTSSPPRDVSCQFWQICPGLGPPIPPPHPASVPSNSGSPIGLGFLFLITLITLPSFPSFCHFILLFYFILSRPAPLPPALFVLARHPLRLLEPLESAPPGRYLSWMLAVALCLCGLRWCFFYFYFYFYLHIIFYCILFSSLVFSMLLLFGSV